MKLSNKKMVFLTLVATTGLIGLGGCSSKPKVPNYICSLNVSEQGKCATMSEALDASMSADPKSKAQSVFEQGPVRSSEGSTTGWRGTSSTGYGSETAAAFAGSQPNGAPVFNQPKVYRPWLAPYTDADGVLRADQYTYFTTPGAWNYGGLKKKGSAASNSMFEPTRIGSKTKLPNASGSEVKSADAPPKPVSSEAKAATQAAVVNGTPPSNMIKSPEANPAAGITQPKQRFTSQN